MFNKRKGSSLPNVLLLTIFFLLAIFVFPVLADDGDSAWGEVLNDDGTIRYDNLIDQGVSSENTDWMPTITLFDFGDVSTSVSFPAEYHTYQTPSGNIIQMPSPLTLLFSALNPLESGLSQASSTTGTYGSGALTAPGVIRALLNGANIDFLNTEFVNANNYADALIAGDTNIWSLGVGDLYSLFQSLQEAGDTDGNLYTMMLLYTPDNIPDGLLPDVDPGTGDDDEDDDIEVPVVECPAPSIAVGAISRSGTLISPNYPLVVGQDPDKRGVDVSFSVSVAPTIYTYYEAVPVIGDECKKLTGSQTSDCTRGNGTPGKMHSVITNWECRVHTQTYPETIPVAYGALQLTSESRAWIEDTLSIRYPGAYVHRASFNFSSSSGSSSWSSTEEHVQVQDPGEWNITVGGRTSGTPVSPARNFGGAVETFQVYLKETAITQ